MGAFCNQLQDPNNPRDPSNQASAVVDMENRLGHHLSIITHYYSFYTPLDDAVLASDKANNRIPIITLTSGGNADAILSHIRDSVIIAQAQNLVKFGKPIFLRYFSEMNRHGINDNHDKDLGYVANESPEIEKLRGEKYIALWRYVHDIFKAHHATNVAWVWSPSDAGGKIVDYAKNYYPGDDYVDWIALNGYNEHAEKVTSFTQKYADYFNYWFSHNKPEMMTETGSPTNMQAQVNWITLAHQNIQTQIPGLKAFNYFNSIGPLNNFILTGEGLNAFINMANDPDFSYYK